jgi:hypothetical protein
MFFSIPETNEVPLEYEGIVHAPDIHSDYNTLEVGWMETSTSAKVMT